MTDEVKVAPAVTDTAVVEAAPQPAEKTILEWFRKAVPNPTQKNLQSQLGCILEEVVELLESIELETCPTRMNDMRALRTVRTHLGTIASGLKEQKIKVDFNYMQSYGQTLDALCDIEVTVRGLAYMMNHDYNGAIEEVNRSNWSKFDADGNPIFNDNAKIIKGPRYTEPNLTKFLVMPTPVVQPVAPVVTDADVVDPNDGVVGD